MPKPDRRLSIAIVTAVILSACSLSPIRPTPTALPPTPFIRPTPLGDPNVPEIPGADEGVDPIEFPGSATGTPSGDQVVCTGTPSGWIAYVIEPGDSLTLLATQTGSTVQELVAANCLANPDDIRVDEVIYLPREPLIDAGAGAIG